ncbi:hypothetical protein D9M72_172840 [compost metagenome]
METLPLLCITHAHSENGEIVELGHVDSHGHLVWRTSVGSVIALYRAGARFVTAWRDKGYEVYVQGRTLSEDARLRTRADGETPNLLKQLPDFEY